MTLLPPSSLPSISLVLFYPRTCLHSTYAIWHMPGQLCADSALAVMWWAWTLTLSPWVCYALPGTVEGPRIWGPTPTSTEPRETDQDTQALLCLQQRVGTNSQVILGPRAAILSHPEAPYRGLE